MISSGPVGAPMLVGVHGGAREDRVLHEIEALRDEVRALAVERLRHTGTAEAASRN